MLNSRTALGLGIIRTIVLLLLLLVVAGALVGPPGASARESAVPHPQAPWSVRPPDALPPSPRSTPETTVARPVPLPLLAPETAVALPALPALPPGPTVQQATAEGRVVLDDGHIDVGARLIDGELRTEVKDGTAVGRIVWRDPADVALHLRPQGRTTVPEGAAFGFLGAPGDDVWILPQVQEAGILWPGWNTEEITDDQLPGGITWELTGVDGPGDFVLFLNGSFGAPTVVFQSADGLPDTFDVPLGTHAHGNWAFTEPGIYRLEYTMSGALPDGTSVSDRSTLQFAVGDVEPAGAFAGGGGGAAAPPAAAPGAATPPGSDDPADRGDGARAPQPTPTPTAQARPTAGARPRPTTPAAPARGGGPQPSAPAPAGGDARAGTAPPANNDTDDDVAAGTTRETTDGLAATGVDGARLGSTAAALFLAGGGALVVARRRHDPDEETPA